MIYRLNLIDVELTTGIRLKLLIKKISSTGNGATASVICFKYAFPLFKINELNLGAVICFYCKIG